MSIKERLETLKKKFKEGVEEERQTRKEEKEAYKKAKEAESKAQAEFKKYEEAQKRIKRIEAAREKGIKDALPGHKKEQAKEIAKKSTSSIIGFLREHVEIAPERPTRRPTKRKMKHKSLKSKRTKRRRY